MIIFDLYIFSEKNFLHCCSMCRLVEKSILYHDDKTEDLLQLFGVIQYSRVVDDVNPLCQICG